VAAALERAAADIEDPLQRLRSHLTRMMLAPREFPPSTPRGAQFMAVERWRLQRAYPAEMDLARKPIVDLIRREIDAATTAGQLDPPGSASSAWFVTELITAVHYHHVFQPAGQPVERVIEELWAFCLAGLRCADQDSADQDSADQDSADQDSADQDSADQDSAGHRGDSTTTGMTRSVRDW
jgi:hypothetical protein